MKVDVTKEVLLVNIQLDDDELFRLRQILLQCINRNADYSTFAAQLFNKLVVD